MKMQKQIHFAKSKKIDFCEMKMYNFIRGDNLKTKTIKRKYLQDVIDVMGTPDIKVIQLSNMLN